MTDDHRLQIVEDRFGKRGSFGDVQSAWLQEQGIVERAGYRQTGPLTGIDLYRITDARTIDEISALVLEQPELRECDFCSTLPARWSIAVRVFSVRMIPGEFKRPIFVCDDCAALVREDNKPALTQRRIEATVAQALGKGGGLAAAVASIPQSVIDRELAPQVREFVDAVIANRTGDPERADVG